MRILGRSVAALVVLAPVFTPVFARPPGIRASVSVLDYGADPSGKKDSAPAINAALASGRDVVIAKGNYVLTAGWISMTLPHQTLSCMPGARLRVVRPGRNPTPALIIAQSAVGARLNGCQIDHDGGQFLPLSPFYPIAWNDGITAIEGKGLANNPQGKTLRNDGFGVGVLVMADAAELRDVTVLRGWDNSIMVANYRMDAPGQSLGPYGVRLTNVRTADAGAGAHSWDPKFYMGCGIDIGTGVDTMLHDVVDDRSHIGFCVDEAGGASAHFVNAISHAARMTKAPFIKPDRVSSYYPDPHDPWHASTISGSAFFFGGSTLSSLTGKPMKDLHESVCTNCQAMEPDGVGVWLSRISDGVRFEGLKIIRPGLEGIWALGGTHTFVDTTIEQPNAFRGSTRIWGVRFPWPQVSAISAHCANCPPFASDSNATHLNLSREQLNTTLLFHGLKIDAGSGQRTYSYVYTTRSTSDETSIIKSERVEAPAGALGLEDRQ